MSWHDHGCPILRTDEIDELIALCRRWYIDYRQGAGGCLHVWLDDGNLDDHFIHDDGYLDQQVAQLPTYLADQRARGYGSEHSDEEIKTTMVRIIELWRTMNEAERYSAYAWHWGYAQRYLTELMQADPVDAYDLHYRNQLGHIKTGPFGRWTQHQP